MSKRPGPAPTVEASCFGCEHEVSERYVVQGESGCNVYCAHDATLRRVGDTNWRTPGWCPLLAEAKLRLSATLAGDGNVLEAEALAGKGAS
jgi:hypothetical protein